MNGIERFSKRKASKQAVAVDRLFEVDLRTGDQHQGEIEASLAPTRLAQMRQLPFATLRLPLDHL